MHRMAGRFYLGTSGFAYDEWRKGVWYPEDLKKDDMLDYYSTQLSSVSATHQATLRSSNASRAAAHDGCRNSIA